MVQHGLLMTCDRCGKTLFEESTDRTDDDEIYWLKWTKVVGLGDLCPVCAQQYKEACEDFMEKARREK